jgi:hypothetical protein
MKKLITLILLLSPVLLFPQNNDTVFMKDGRIVPCTINKIESNVMFCTRVFNNDKSFDGTIKLIEVGKYTLAIGSNIEPNIKYNPDIITILPEQIYTYDENSKITKKVKTIEFSDSVIIQGQNSGELYDNIKNWFAVSDEKITKKIIFESKSIGRIDGTFSIPFYDGITTPKDIKSSGTITFNVSVSMKDSMYKYTFSNYYHIGNEYVPGGAITFGAITPGGFIDLGFSKHWQNNKLLTIKKTATYTTKNLMNELKEIILKFPAENK